MLATICAMTKEQDAILDRMTDVQVGVINNVYVHTGKLKGIELVTCLSGVGKVNAATATAVLISRLNVDKVVDIGVAGALDKSLKANDVVIADKLVQWDFNDNVNAFPLTYDTNLTACVADSKINEAIKKALPDSIIGEMVTGDSFISTNEQYENIKRLYPEAIACDMEAGAIGSVCRRMNVPFAIVRSISDTSNDSETKVSYDEFVYLACQKAADILEEIVDKI